MAWIPRLLIYILLSHFSLSIGLLARANVRVLPRSTSDFAFFKEELRSGEAVWVDGVKVAYVNYFALRRDFPKLKLYSEQQIDLLLIQNFSYISKFQLDMGEIRNTKVPADLSRTRNSFRPSGYRRADIMEFFDFSGELLGLIDRKGSGLPKYAIESELKSAQELGPEKIQTKDHSDGLMTLGETLVETSREKARRQLYRIEKVDAETVESYFSMLWPFQIKKGHGQLVAAGLYGRQAHLGHMQSGFETPLPSSERAADQMDFFGAGFDQGRVRIVDPRFADTFGKFGPRVYESQKVADWSWAHETAAAFSLHGNRDSIEKHLAEMTQPLQVFNPQDSSERSASFQGDLDRFFSKYGDLNDPHNRLLMSHTLTKFKDTTLIEKYDIMEKLISLMLDPDAKIRARSMHGLKIIKPEQRKPLLLRLSQDVSSSIQMDLLRIISFHANFLVSEKEIALENLAKSKFANVQEAVAKKLAADKALAMKRTEKMSLPLKNSCSKILRTN